MPYAGDKWEFKTRNIGLGYTKQELEDELNNQGANGWFLMMFYKRKDKMLLVYCRKIVAQ